MRRRAEAEQQHFAKRAAPCLVHLTANIRVCQKTADEINDGEVGEHTRTQWTPKDFGAAKAAAFYLIEVLYKVNYKLNYMAIVIR